MVISYKKLWKLLIDKDLKKKNLPDLAGVSRSSVTKLGHNDHVSTEILLKRRNALQCDFFDIMELVHEHT